MSKSEHNRFCYKRSDAIDDAFILRATMTDFAYGIHTHEEFSIGVTLSGRQDFFTLGAHRHSYPGNTIVFNPGEAHNGSSGTETTLHYLMLYLTAGQVEAILKSLGLPADALRTRTPILNDERLSRLVLQLAALLENPTTTTTHCESVLFELISCLAGQQPGSVATAPIRHDRQLDRAMEFLQDHIHEELSLERLAAEVSLSKFHFLRRFKAYTGMTPHQYRLNLRILQARQALHRGDCLSDIVHSHGFNDLSHFNRRFKPVVGMTPYQYQHQLPRKAS